MARFSDVDVFLAVADVGSFRGAAARLEVTRSTISRAVARLEAHLGAQLLHRDTASVRLTDAGIAYKRGARKAAAALTEAERDARAVTGEVSGAIRLTAPRAFSQMMTRCVAGFLQSHPDVRMDLLLTDRMVNPILDGIDIAIRTGQRLSDSDLKVRRLADLEMIAVATPQLASQLPDLEVLPAVAFVRPDGAVWRYDGAAANVGVRLSVNDYLSVRDAVLCGVGLGVVSARLVALDLEAGRVVRVMPSWKLPGGKIWAVYPARGSLPAKLRLMLDTLAAGFAA